MAEPLVTLVDRRTDFLGGVDLQRMFRVAPDVFPTAIDVPAVPARHAAFMRPGDWVIGVRIGDAARCYPAWMADNVHAINDTLAGVAIAVFHCEICASNAVFAAASDGERRIFRTAGLYGGTLAVADLATGSVWSHGQGVAIAGPLAGRVLPLIQSFQATFAEWTALHPDTTVMTWPAPAIHPDARHGHGFEDTFARPGMDPKAVASMDVGNDPRLPENEMVVTLHDPEAPAALPLRALARAGGLVACELAGGRVVTLSGGADSALAGSFRPHLEGEPERALDLEARAGRIRDRRTGSTWRVDGLAVAGALAGRRLHPFPTVTSKWHSLACFQPGIRLLEPAENGAAEEPPALAPALAALRKVGLRVAHRHPLYALERPDGSVLCHRLAIDGDPFDLLLFEDAAAAEDTCPARSVRSGPLVLASAPRRRFADDLGSRPLPDDAIAWSSRLCDPRLRRAAEAAAAAWVPRSPDAGGGVRALCRALARRGYPAAAGAACPRDAIPPRAVNGCTATIAGDPFLVYRFAAARDAEAWAAGRERVLRADRFVLRPDPDDLYELGRPTWTRRRRDEDVTWSRLLGDARFRAALRSCAAEPRAGG